MDARLSCFKAYDVRGRVPDVLDAGLAYALGVAAAEQLGARVVLGRDARLSGPYLCNALVAGLHEAGAEVTDLGLCGTEEIYYAAANGPFDIGVMCTGSHNPADENGFKLVRRGAVPVSRDSGLTALRDRAGEILYSAPAWQERENTAPEGRRQTMRPEYVRHLLNMSGAEKLRPVRGRRPLRLVADAGNGCAGLVLEELAEYLPFDFLCLHMEPDGSFPNGVPNPLLPDRRAATAAAVREAGADMGIAWDGDFDRCFFYDGDGTFIEGYYCIGLLAQELLRGAPGAKIVHDTRVYWNTRDLVRHAGGVPVMGKAGHAFMKERMREENALYGGEMSAHHYFRDFAYCDSGMLPWLLIATLLHRTCDSLASLVAERRAAYPCSGEINRRVRNAPALLERVCRRYASQASHVDGVDGINLEFPQWRFNLRMSNTEPLLRLNVESRGNNALLEDKTAEILAFLEAEGDAATT